VTGDRRQLRSVVRRTPVDREDGGNGEAVPV
jgi:hypothetical protein